ncbi:MAG TPA: DEAD/DEAH box helicase [Polyangiaceae bacterium]|nr:DEAD/DEAH box helicase [Polyangiaceae bacterium]
MQELFESVRAACPSGIWSKAVDLVRLFAVTQQSADSTQITCRVRRADRAIPATVQLYPADAEWDCDCESRAPCCEHVAAAVIAIKKARSEGKPLPETMTSAANLGYGFRRLSGELACERQIVRSDGSKAPLRVSLASVVTQHAAGFDITPSQNDLQLDRIIPSSGAIRPEQVLTVLKMLEGHANVEFEGKPVQVQTEPRRPRATISATGDGFLVKQSADPEIVEVVASFVGRTETSLVPLAATEYCGAKYEKLVPARVYAEDEVSVLVNEVLPDLKRWFLVDVQTDRLPEITNDERPRILLEIAQAADQLSVLGLLVYGDPPIARVDKNRMVHLGGPVPVRKLDLERRAMENLRQSLGLVVGVRAVVSGKEALQLAAKLDHWHGEIQGCSPERWIEDATLRPVLDDPDSLPHFAGRSSDGGELAATLETAVKAYREGLSLVPLLEGGFARLPADFMTRHIELLERLLAARRNDDPQRLVSHAAPAQLELCEALRIAPSPRIAALKQLQSELREPAPVLPADLTVTPRHYQLAGIRWLQQMQELELGAVLADDMGLGKTLQAICVIRNRTLVVCPTTLVANWLAEIQRFRPKLNAAVYRGKDRTLDVTADIIITSYALLRLDLETLANASWDTIILDEAQAIKNPDSQVARAAFMLDARFKLTLSGTPIENRLDELWSQLHFTNRGLLGSREQFQRMHAEPIHAGNLDAAANLRKIVSPFILRRTKQAVLPELPPRFEHDLYCVLDDEERELYDQLQQLAQREILAELANNQGTMRALEILLRLRQAACHRALVPGQSANSSSKVELLLVQLESILAEGQKALVFSQWTSFLDQIEPQLQQAEIAFARLDGNTKDRAQVVDTFQGEDGPSVLLLSLKAAGTGLNLTAAEHVFLMDLWWNPAVERQAADRAHRIGQERPVFVHRIVAKGTVEERILLLHAQKRALSDLAFEDADRASALSREDLILLLT